MQVSESESEAEESGSGSETESEDSESESSPNIKKNAEPTESNKGGEESSTSAKKTEASILIEKPKKQEVKEKKRKAGSVKNSDKKDSKKSKKHAEVESVKKIPVVGEGENLEKKHDDISEGAEDENKKKFTKKEPRKFNDRNVDYNLFENDPCNVITKKCKLNNTLLMICKMVDGTDARGNGYEHAALVFEKKSKNDNVFEFSVPLSVIPNMIEGLQLMMKDNARFFKFENKI